MTLRNTFTKLIIPTFKNFFGQMCLSHIIPVLINKLPPEFKKTVTPKNLTHKLKKHYIEEITLTNQHIFNK